MNDEQACEAVGLSSHLFRKIIDQSVYAWRNSTSTSFFHGIGYLKLGQVPPVGKAIFPDLRWQTRFLLMCEAIKYIRKMGMSRVRDADDKPIVIGGEWARTVSNTDINMVNDAVRCLYLYWLLNTLRAPKKLPKTIYRGIRAHDLYGHQTFKPACDAIWASDKTHDMKRKEAIDLLIRWICERKLHQITDGNVLSFSSSQSIASYFAHKEGFLLAVDPTKVEIITSELHDTRLAGKDGTNGKNEREYIVRIPTDYDFTPANVIMYDLAYFVAEQNPLCVETFNHDDLEAEYTLNGLTIKAWYSWSSNDTGSLVFRCEEKDLYGIIGRGQFKKKFGFDPLPQKSNLPLISNFRTRARKRW